MADETTRMTEFTAADIVECIRKTAALETRVADLETRLAALETPETEVTT